MIISCDFLRVCLCVSVCVLNIWYFCCVFVVVVVFSTILLSHVSVSLSPGGDAESPHVFVSLWLRLVLLSQDTCLCLRLPCNVCNCV